MSAAKELAKFGIIVNAVAPGAATPMTETIRTDERFREKYLERIPVGRWAEPEEIAPVFVFLASDAAQLRDGSGDCRRRRHDDPLTHAPVSGGVGAPRSPGYPIAARASSRRLAAARST